MLGITIYHRIISVFLIIVMLQSCSTYKIKSIPESQPNFERTINNKSSQRYYYILHVGNEAWQLKNVDVSETEITAKIVTMTPKVRDYMVNAYEGGSRRVLPGEQRYVRQLHIHAKQFTQTDDLVTVNISDIESLNLMKYNGNKNALIITGSVIGSIGIFLAVVCNCPHTYIYDGEKYYLSNTLFTGATSEKLERNDFKLMPDYNSDSTNYSFYVKNEESEIQFTNLLELIVVYHELDSEIALSENGNIYSIKRPAKPLTVMDNSGNIITDIVSYEDKVAHLFDNESEDSQNSIYASFEKPENTENIKLILSVKNTSWSGFVYNEFSKMFGKYYDNWVKQNKKKSKEEVYRELKKVGVPLVVSVKQNGSWIDIEELELVGDVGFNQLAVPIRSELLSDSMIEIRIRSGFMFWELDYLSLDSSGIEDFSVQRIKPASAIGNTGDVTNQLQSDDNEYMKHEQIGDSTVIKFTGIDIVPNQKRTIYLHSKGYYLPQKEFKGKLQRKELEAVDIEGGLSVLSRKLYGEIFKSVAKTH